MVTRSDALTAIGRESISLLRAPRIEPDPTQVRRVRATAVRHRVVAATAAVRRLRGQPPEPNLVEALVRLQRGIVHVFDEEVLDQVVSEATRPSNQGGGS